MPPPTRVVALDLMRPPAQGPKAATAPLAPRVPSPASHSKSGPPAGAARPRRGFRFWPATPRGKRVAASVTAGLLALALFGGGLYLAFRAGDDDPGRYYSVYVTDLPGGLERVKFTLASVTIGDAGYPLRVEAPEVLISDHQGPQEALRVASGYAPREADASVRFVFAGASGYRDGTWEDLDVPEGRLVLADACPPEAGLGCAALFDFDLSASVAVRSDGSVAFQPYVSNAYHTTIHEDAPDSFHLENVTNNLIEITNPVQYREIVPDEELKELLRGLCAVLGCTPPAGSNATTPTDAPTTPSCPVPLVDHVCPTAGTSTDTDTATTTTGGPPGVAPGAPRDPTPAVNAASTLPATLTWAADAPPGKVVYYDVYVNGQEVSSCHQVTTRSCLVDESHFPVGQGVHAWYVVAKVVDGPSTQGHPWTLRSDRAPLPPTSFDLPDGTTEVPVDPTTLTWEGASDPDGESLQYRIYYNNGDEDGNVNLASPKTDWGTATSWNTGDKIYDYWYYWKVEVKDLKGRTAMSEVVRFKTRHGDGDGDVLLPGGA